MYSYDDIKLMFDWGLFTPEQVAEFVPSCITEEEFTKMTGKPFSKSQAVFIIGGIVLSNEIVVAVIGLVGSTFGAFIGVVASANLTAYRIEQLEKKVEKHNGVIERTFKLEGRMQEAEHDIIELKGAKK